MNESKRQRLLKRDYIALEFEAMRLYIKHGLSAEAISKQLNISMPTLSKWSKAGRWKELRPDMDLLNQYKAAKLYIVDGLQSGEISQRLSLQETIVKMWIELYGWQAARLVSRRKM